MPGEPLVVLHVALTEDISDNIQVRTHAAAGIWKGVSQFSLLYRILKLLEFAVCSSTTSNSLQCDICSFAPAAHEKFGRQHICHCNSSVYG